jgi:casein kinase II subunit alpha
VYAAINNITGEKVVIKVLKPTKMERVHREVMIMKILKGADHIVNLIEVIRDPNTTEPSLVM